MIIWTRWTKWTWVIRSVMTPYFYDTKYKPKLSECWFYIEYFFFVHFFYCNNNITLHTKITYSTYSANIAYDLTILATYNTNIVYNLISSVH